MAYFEECLPHLHNKGTITAMEVHQITGTTASHKVIQQLTVKKIIDGGEWVRATSGKRYKVHKLISRDII